MRILLEGDAALADATRRFPAYVTSALTLIEVPRALARARRDDRISARDYALVQRRFRAFARNCTIIEVTLAIRERAALEMPIEPVRALDAIHLATVVVGSGMIGATVVASCDRRVRQNALALGYEIIPDVEPDTA